VLRDLTDLLSNNLGSEQQEALVLEILAHGRTAGWLGDY